MARSEDIAAIDGIGPKIAEAVREFLSIPRNLAVIERLRKAEVSLEQESFGQLPQRRKFGKNMIGKRVVVTGLSALTPIGNSLKESWDNIEDRKSVV